MPRVIGQQELDQVVTLLETHKDGLGIAALEQAAKEVGLELNRRTLQRRLNQLIAAERVLREGEGRASRYRLAARVGLSSTDISTAQTVAFGEIHLPLSLLGREIKRLVCRPLSEREPVGYNRAFLEDYEPNSSAYLPDALLSRLHTLGRSPVRDQAAGTYARDILNRLMIDLSWASSRLEGNTYSRLDTQNLIEFGQAAEGKGQRETQMILNHKSAIEMLVDYAEEIGFDTFTLFNLHALLSENLLADASASGRLRTSIVEIGGSVFHPLAVPQQIEGYFRLILDKANAIVDPFEQAFFVMVQIPYLQPFLDVNKRVSRLGANIPLIKHNLSPLSFVDVPEQAYVEGILGVYELNRIELLRDVFVWAYERSCRRYVAIKESLPEPDPLRLRNREALIQVVSEVVRGGKPIEMQAVRDLAVSLVLPADLDQFVAMVFNDLHHLHEGNIVRYRLRLAEYRRWKKILTAVSKA
jgi:hypothetical protein